MFDRAIATCIQLSKTNNIMIIDFRQDMNQRYLSDSNWQQVYQNDFVFENGIFSFKNTFVNITDNINFESLLSKDSKIQKFSCFQILGGSNYGSEIVLANGQVAKVTFPHPNNDVMLFRILNSTFLIIPENPTGKLIVCDVPGHLFDKNIVINGYNCVKPMKSAHAHMFNHTNKTSFTSIDTIPNQEEEHKYKPSNC
jgi:hypothetical protein